MSDYKNADFLQKQFAEYNSYLLNLFLFSPLKYSSGSTNSD